jgi:hypothetical protein
MLRPFAKLLKSCPFGHILDCRGVACVVPLLVDKAKVNIDFHIFDVLDLDLLLGSPVGKLLDASQGNLDEKLREAALATTPLFSESSMVKPLPKQNPLEEMMHVSLFASSKPILVEVVDFSYPQKYDLGDALHLCEGERSSSPLNKFEPLSTGPYHVALNLGRESTSILLDESLKMENSWAMEIYETLTLESKGKDSTDEHGNFTHDIPTKPCSHLASPELAMLSALGILEYYNNLLVLSCKKPRRMVVDAYVYHKHCRFHLCFVALTLLLKLHRHINNWWWGNTSPIIAARGYLMVEFMTVNKALPGDSLD